MSTYPPDDWSMNSGTWGVDADRNTTITAIGGSSIEFKNTATAPEMVSGFYPVEQYAAYHVHSIMRADSITAGDTVAVLVDFYAANRSSWMGTKTIHNGVLSAANLWLPVDGVIESPSGSRYARYRVSKSVGGGFTAYLDYINMRRHPAWARAYADTATTLTAGAWTKVVFQIQEYDYGQIYDLGNTRFKANRDGIFTIKSTVLVSAVPANTLLVSAVYVNGSEVLRSDRVTSPGVASAVTLQTAADIVLSYGDYVEIYVYNGAASSLSTYTGSNICFASMIEVR